MKNDIISSNPVLKFVTLVGALIQGDLTLVPGGGHV